MWGLFPLGGDLKGHDSPGMSDLVQRWFRSTGEECSSVGILGEAGEFVTSGALDNGEWCGYSGEGGSWMGFDVQL